MKKLLIFALVLGLASMASAVPILRVDPADTKDHYEFSDIITIQLYDEGSVIGISMDAINDGGGGGAAVSGSQVFHSAFTSHGAGYYNTDGQLVEYAWGIMTAYPPVATGVLWSFDYHVPDVPVSTIINITSMNDGGDTYYPLEVDYSDGSAYMAPPELGVAIHVIPEPATIALLGLGGLLLRRKK